jgi:cyanophycinase
LEEKMRKWHIFVIVFFGILARAGFAETKGYLFIIGGGDRPESMMRKFIELSGRFGSGKIVIFPMASSTPAKTGRRLASEFKKYGVREAEYYVLTRKQALKEESANILNDVGGVYFSGGDQSLQMNVLRHTPIHKKLLNLYEKGCVIGGTSAGAAVMSEVMITGDERKKVKEGDEFKTIEAENIVTVEGFGFLKTAIIDQHFATRKRHNRLISLVAEKPQLLGVGIDESTAIIVKPGEVFDVVGTKNVVIYDGSQAKIRITPSKMIGFTGMIMHVLLPGDRFDLKARKVVR